jgi:hypothetical protein
VAPIAVMWFGFDWPSKAAVVVLMTFFPMLVSTLAGLQGLGQAGARADVQLRRQLQPHLVVAAPAGGLPFIFGALKVNATLALIGAIVAEFFGSPTVGLGFRISTEAARMNMSLVWGAIVVAAVTGSLAYALLVQLERRAAFWHPSCGGNNAQLMMRRTGDASSQFPHWRGVSCLKADDPVPSRFFFSQPKECSHESFFSGEQRPDGRGIGRVRHERTRAPTR